MIQRLKVADLKSALRQLGGRVTGNKPQLRDRMHFYLNSSRAETLKVIENIHRKSYVPGSQHGPNPSSSAPHDRRRHHPSTPIHPNTRTLLRGEGGGASSTTRIWATGGLSLPRPHHSPERSYPMAASVAAPVAPRPPPQIIDLEAVPDAPEDALRMAESCFLTNVTVLLRSVCMNKGVHCWCLGRAGTCG